MERYWPIISLHFHLSTLCCDILTATENIFARKECGIMALANCLAKPSPQHFDVMSPTLSKTSLHGKKCDIIEFVKLLAKHLQQVRELFFCYVFQITTLLVNNPKNAFT